MAIKIQHEGDPQAHRFMLVNTNDIYCKQRFTACHEFYHLIYQQNFSKSVDDFKYSSKEREEKNANSFASFLLLPEAGLKMLAPVEEQRKDRITLGTILKLEQHFRCSRATLLYRLKELGWISEDIVQSYIENVKRSAAEYGYNTSLYEPTGVTEICGDYNIKARRLFDKGLITFDDNGKILFSDDLSASDRLLTNLSGDCYIKMNNSMKEYMNWHRTHTFKKG